MYFKVNSEGVITHASSYPVDDGDKWYPFEGMAPQYDKKTDKIVEDDIVKAIIEGLNQ